MRFSGGRFLFAGGVLLALGACATVEEEPAPVPPAHAQAPEAAPVPAPAPVEPAPVEADVPETGTGEPFVEDAPPPPSEEVEAAVEEAREELAARPGQERLHACEGTLLSVLREAFNVPVAETIPQLAVALREEYRGREPGDLLAVLRAVQIEGFEKTVTHQINETRGISLWEYNFLCAEVRESGDYDSIATGLVIYLDTEGRVRDISWLERLGGFSF